ncbi:hypothetical protein V1951_23155, partial [Yersinia sp. 2544 StPb PI]|uniref:hypothetical protein n=1 Tax=Yersinia sp. 2544 StPb PI TaxID=3117409 RepID=UPI003B27C07F
EFLNNGIAYSDILDNDTFNFCIECIEESYKENGVGYLKREWLNSKCCNKHKTPLFTVLNHSLRDSVEIMMDLMSGKKPHSHNYRLNTRRETKYSKNIETDFDPASTLYIKPCAKEVFNKWIRDHKHSLLKIIPPRYHSQDNLHRVHLFQQNPSIYIADLYLNRHNNNLLEFKNFIFKNTRIVIEKHGVNREDSFSDRIMKDRNMKCENCNINSPSTPCKMQHKTNGRNI